MSISQNFPEEGPTLNLNFAGSKTLDPRITFIRPQTGNEAASYVDESGIIRYTSADEPRFDHDPETRECLGLLVEERRVNLLPSSENVDYASYHQKEITTSLNVAAEVAPDGTATADEIAPTATTDEHFIGYPLNVTSGTTYTFSAYVKPNGTDSVRIRFASVGFSNQNGSHVFSTNTTTSGNCDFKITPVANGWYRIQGTAVASSTGNGAPRIYLNNTNSWLGVPSEALYVWGAQLEVGAFPTSYIPTSGSTATRNHDRVYYENVDQTEWFNKTEGTVVFEHTDVPYSSSNPDTGWPAVGFANTGGGSNPAIQYFITKDYGDAQYLVRRFYPGGDSANITPPGGTGSAAPASKVGFVYKADDYALVRNGSLVGTDTSGAVPDAYTLIFGMNGVTATDNNWNAHLKNLQYYPTRLSNTVLQNLTK